MIICKHTSSKRNLTKFQTKIHLDFHAITFVINCFLLFNHCLTHIWLAVNWQCWIHQMIHGPERVILFPFGEWIESHLRAHTNTHNYSHLIIENIILKRIWFMQIYKFHIKAFIKLNAHNGLIIIINWTAHIL